MATKTLLQRLAAVEELRAQRERDKPVDLRSIYAKLGIADIEEVRQQAHQAGQSVMSWVGITRGAFEAERARRGQ